ncbi:hypothetical protein ACWCQL_22780 [Streptomyces sp. NPDC002073]
MSELVIRVWLDGEADPNDLGDLKAWLECEEPLEELVRSADLLVEEQVRRDASPDRMGPDWEIVLRVAETFTGIAMLVEQTKRAVDAWRTHRGGDGQGAPPNPRVEPPQDSDEG